MRHDGRKVDELRAIKVKRRFTRAAAGSVLIEAGRTAVLCTASVSAEVPPWMKNEPGGWVTAEYAMLPGSTAPASNATAAAAWTAAPPKSSGWWGGACGRWSIWRRLGPRTVTVDCDVLEADGGTRTLSVTGGFIALVDAVRRCRPSCPPRPGCRCGTAWRR